MNTGNGSIYKRGHVYWISYYYRGERIRESSKSKLKKAASELLKKRIREMGMGGPVGPDPEKVTFEDLAEMIETDYKVNGRKSTRRLRTSLKHLRRHLGRFRALDITTDRINTYIADRQDEGAANASIQKETAALKRMFRLAKQANRIPTIPHVPVPRVRNVRTDFLSMADVDAICARIGRDLAPVVRFAALTGWRKEEVLGLRWADVDFDAGTVRLRPGTTKNDEGRTFPFRALPQLEALLNDQRERTRALERETGEIIPQVFHRDGKPIRSMRTAWNNAAKMAGLGGAWFHDLRRTAVRNLEKAGVSRSVAMKLTGHRTEAVYRRYAIADEVALAEGVEKLAQLHTGASPTRKVVPIEEAKKA